MQKNKGGYGAFYPKGRFLFSNISPRVIRYFSSKETLPVKVYLDLSDIKTIYEENKRRSGIYLIPGGDTS